MVTIYPYQKKKFSEALTRLESFNLISLHATLNVTLDTASAFQLNKKKRRDKRSLNTSRKAERKYNYIIHFTYITRSTSIKPFFFPSC